VKHGGWRQQTLRSRDCFLAVEIDIDKTSAWLTEENPDVLRPISREILVYILGGYPAVGPVREFGSLLAVRDGDHTDTGLPIAPGRLAGIPTTLVESTVWSFVIACKFVVR
jgi:hypothetical protein